jgi:glyoxylase-like metal-dependent hydrolase (beta-lactamase superfamily II)
MSDQSDDALTFDRTAIGTPGLVQSLTPLVRRVLAPNQGPFTFTGTCTYIVGSGHLALIGPGPDLAEHIELVLHELRGQSIDHIVITHTHRDHSPAARAIQAATGAQIIGCAAHQPAQAASESRMDASHDLDHKPDLLMQEGDVLSADGFHLEAIATPGHAANHLCFALREENSLFSGDHVMAWSTSIVAPPDGNMADYMHSLDKLRSRSETIFWPGHGGAVQEPQRFMRGLVHHRRQREASILKCLASGHATIAEIVPRIYEGLDPRLIKGASLSVLAHLQDLLNREKISSSSGRADLEAQYKLGAGLSRIQD